MIFLLEITGKYCMKRLEFMLKKLMNENMRLIEPLFLLLVEGVDADDMMFFYSLTYLMHRILNCVLQRNTGI